ncbi:MAG: type III pantothenate kinase [Steroidobacteraceae bacterium]
MNTWLFDAGNSRIKWALVRDGRLGALQAAALDDTTALQRWLARSAQIDRAVGVCVAGAAYERILKSALQRAGLPAPEFVKSSATAAGVSNGYREAWRLGDDRWAGAVAAWHRAGCYRTVCAVSIGTALTIDLVDHDGHHRGGLIAPGPEVMLGSLLGKTHGIAERASTVGTRRRPAQGRRGVVRPLADNTREAIEAGCLTAAAGVIDRTINQVTRELGVRPVVFVTGGGADSVLPLLKGANKPCPELVLRGVALLADVPIRRRA